MIRFPAKYSGLVVFLVWFALSSGSGCKGEIGVSADNPSLGSSSSTPDPVTTPSEPNDSVDPVGDTNDGPVDDTSDGPESDPTIPDAQLPELSAEHALFYMRTIAPMLVSRPLTVDEIAALEEEREAAIPDILSAWVDEPAFAGSARYMMEDKLRASGDRDGIDFDAPGRLVEHVVSNDLPFSQIITADYCIDPDFEQAECDSGAPYAAGVMTTRAFLAGNASRFNLGRASRMLGVFACRHYPMEDSIQPRLPKEVLTPMFRALTADEQTVEEAKNAFGNGNGCYTCHGQFAPHSQFFVKFDEDGRWVQDATGAQDPDGELGRSFDGLMRSHLEDPDEMADEGSDMFGQRADNLADAAKIMAETDTFIPCSVRNVLEYTFGMSETAAASIDRKLLDSVANRVTSNGTHDPSFAELVVETFSDPRVVEVVLNSRGDLK